MGRLGRDGRNLKPKDSTLSSALVSCRELRLRTESNLYCIGDGGDVGDAGFLRRLNFVPRC